MVFARELQRVFEHGDTDAQAARDDVVAYLALAGFQLGIGPRNFDLRSP